MDDLRDVTFADVQAALPRVRRHLAVTPLHEVPGLSEIVGARVHVKFENRCAVGAFKVRGGVNLAATLADAARRPELMTASTGNHGQSIAFAGRVTGAPVRVAVPEGANPSKIASMVRLGAQIEVHGRDFDEAREWMAARAAQGGARFVGPTDPELIAGVGTYAIELMDQLPSVDVIVVPVGAGSGAAATALVAKTIRPGVRVIGVQAERAPAIARSWRAGKAVAAAMETDAEGLATRVAHDNTLRMLRDPATGLDDFLLVSDEAMAEAVRLYLEHAHTVAELAGAAPAGGGPAGARSPRRGPDRADPERRQPVDGQATAHPRALTPAPDRAGLRPSARIRDAIQRHLPPRPRLVRGLVDFELGEPEHHEGVVGPPGDAAVELAVAASSLSSVEDRAVGADVQRGPRRGPVAHEVDVGGRWGFGLQVR